MTKKRTILFIMGVVCACVLSCAFVFTGCGKNKHDYSVLKYDENGHWYECADDDGETDGYEAHTYDAGTVTKATCTEAGYTTYTCTVCGYSYEETNEEDPATGHSLSKTEAEAATCTEDGNIEYWTCSVCNKTFSDAEGTKEVTDVVISATGHTYGTPATTDWTWTPTEDGYTVTVTLTCESNDDTTTVDADVTSVTDENGDTTYAATVTINGQTFTDTLEVPAASAHDFSGDPTWTLARNDDGTYTATATWTCQDEGCDETKSESAAVTGVTDTANCTQEGTLSYTGSVTLASGTYTVTAITGTSAAWGHSMTPTAATEATCTEAGNATYWTCSRCSLVFKDADGSEQYTETDEYVIPATGHTYGEVVWNWEGNETDGYTATATATCLVCGNVDVESGSEAQPEDDGITYTSSVTIGGQQYPGTLVVRLYATDAEDDAEDIKTNDGTASYEATDLSVELTTSAEGYHVYTLTGTASLMSDEVAAEFGDGAENGDAYVLFKIYVEDGYTVVFNTSAELKVRTNSEDGNPGSFNDDNYMFICWRLTGYSNSGEKEVTTNGAVFSIYSAYDKETETGTLVDTVVVSFDGVKIRVSATDATADAADLVIDEDNSFEATDLTVTTSKTSEGNVYTLNGTANIMSEAVATWFKDGAAEGDAYVLFKIYVEPGYTVVWNTSAGEKVRVNDGVTNVATFNEDNYMFICWRLTGYSESGAKYVTTNNATFYIYSTYDKTAGEGTLVDTVVVSFAGVNIRVYRTDAKADAEDIVIDETEETYFEATDLTIVMTVDEDGNTVYTLYGEADKMSNAVAEWFKDGAAENDLYVLFKIYVEPEYTIVWNTSAGVKVRTNSKDGDPDSFSDNYMYICWRLSGYSNSGEKEVTTNNAVFYIYSSYDAENTEDNILIDTVVVSFAGISNLPVKGESGDGDGDTPAAEATEHTNSFSYEELVEAAGYTTSTIPDGTRLNANLFNTDSNSFLTYIGSSSSDKIRDSSKGTCIEIKGEGLTVTFEGTGTLTITFKSSGNGNTSTLALIDGNGNYVQGVIDQSTVGYETVGEKYFEGKGYYYMITDPSNNAGYVTITFTITEAGTYTIATSIEKVIR